MNDEEQKTDRPLSRRGFLKQAGYAAVAGAVGVGAMGCENPRAFPPVIGHSYTNRHKPFADEINTTADVLNGMSVTLPLLHNIDKAALGGRKWEQELSRLYDDVWNLRRLETERDTASTQRSLIVLNEKLKKAANGEIEGFRGIASIKADLEALMLSIDKGQYKYMTGFIADQKGAALQNLDRIVVGIEPVRQKLIEPRVPAAPGR